MKPLMSANRWIIGVVMAYLLIISNMGGLWIYALDEAKNATCAFEMKANNTWVVPTFNGELRTDKPPLHYYFMRLSYSLFGYNELAARLFSALCGLVVILTTYFFTRKHLGETAAQLASAGLLLSLHFALQMQMAVPDPYLVACTTCSIFLLFEGHHTGASWRIYLAYGCIGLGALAKGPIAFALPGLTVLFFLIASRQFQWKAILSFKPFRGVLLALLICVPWYWAVHKATGGAWTEGFFFKHNLNRFTSTMEGHGGTFLLTWAFVLIGMLPLLPFALASLRHLWKQRAQPFILFAACASLAVIGFFTFSSTRLPNYTVPAYPFLAVLSGMALSHLANQKGKFHVLRTASWIVWVFSLAIPAGAYVALYTNQGLQHLAGVALYLLPFPMGAGFMVYYFYRQKANKGLKSLFLGYLLGIIAFFWMAFPPIDQQNPVAQTSFIFDDHTPIIGYKIINPAYVFYAEEPIPVYDSLDQILEHAASFDRVFVITRARYTNELLERENVGLVAEQPDLFENSRTAILLLRKKN